MVYVNYVYDFVVFCAKLVKKRKNSVEMSIFAIRNIMARIEMLVVE